MRTLADYTYPEKSNLKESLLASTPGASYPDKISQAVVLLQGKWTVPILCAMMRGPVRLSELKRRMPAASKKAITASLRSLEQQNIVIRRDLSAMVLHVEYELAKEMQKPVFELLHCLAYWIDCFQSRVTSEE
jgi:DNA-binding HxlR family transcriptional regulator